MSDCLVPPLSLLFPLPDEPETKTWSIPRSPGVWMEAKLEPKGQGYLLHHNINLRWVNSSNRNPVYGKAGWSVMSVVISVIEDTAWEANLALLERPAYPLSLKGSGGFQEALEAIGPKMVPHIQSVPRRDIAGHTLVPGALFAPSGGVLLVL